MGTVFLFQPTNMDRVKESLTKRDGVALLSNLMLIHADDWTTKCTEYLEIVSMKDFSTFWALLEEQIDRLCERSFQDDVDLLEKLHRIVDLVKLALKATKNRGDFYFRVIETLHNIMQIPTNAEGVDANNPLGNINNPTVKSFISLKNNIAQFCEHYYLQHDYRYEELFPQLVLYLLIEALTPGCKETLIKRLYHLRHGFLHLDLLTASSKEFSQDLLLRCFVHPLFLKCIEGQKLLGTLLLVSDGKYSLLFMKVFCC